MIFVPFPWLSVGWWTISLLRQSIVCECSDHLDRHLIIDYQLDCSVGDREGGRERERGGESRRERKMERESNREREGGREREKASERGIEKKERARGRGRDTEN